MSDDSELWSDEINALVDAAFETVSRNPSDHETAVAYRRAIRAALCARDERRDGENARSAVEGEARQPGPAKQDAPNPSDPSPGDHRVIEAMAVKLADAGGFRWGDLQDVPYSVFDDPQGSQRYWRKLALAALQALIEAGPEYYPAVDIGVDMLTEWGYQVTDTEVERVFTTMLRASLPKQEG